MPSLFRPQVEPLTAERVRRVRHKLGLTQEELGSVLGYTGNTVGAWEDGRNMDSRLFLRQSRTISLALAELERQFDAHESQHRSLPDQPTQKKKAS